MFLKQIIVGSLGTNCYLAGDKENLLLIDPGADTQRILKTINENECKVKYIVLTHCHYDHIGAVEELCKDLGVKVLISRKEKENYMSNAVTLRSYFGDSSKIKEPDILLEEGDIISSGNFQFKVIETPGHTSGGICILCDDILFSGDTLFRESIGRTDFPTGSMPSLLESVRNKLFTLPHETEVYPGHGEKTTIGYEIDNNMFF